MPEAKHPQPRLKHCGGDGAGWIAGAQRRHSWWKQESRCHGWQFAHAPKRRL